MNRNYGVDLGKIMAMFMIVMGHIILSGGLNAAVGQEAFHGTINYYFVFGIRLVTICAVNVFVIATGYLYYGRSVRVARVFELWCQIVFLSVLVLIGARVFGYIPTTRQICQTFMPITTSHYWFVTHYFLLLLFVPVLNRLLDSLDGRWTAYLLMALLFVFSIIPTFVSESIVPVAGGYCVTWFAVLFLFGATLRKYDCFKRMSLLLTVGLFVASIVGDLIVAVYGSWMQRRFGVSGGCLCYQYNSPFVLLEAIAFFALFSKVEVKNDVARKCIAFVSPLVFGVYVLHSNSIFRSAFRWADRWSGWVAYSPLHMLFRLVALSCVIFIACIIVDYLRLLVFKTVKICVAKVMAGGDIHV